MIRVERRLDVPRWLMAVTPLIALCIAMLIGAVVLWVSGQNPISTYRTIFQTSFTSAAGASQLLVTTSPLLLTGLCAAAAFSVGLYNIGGEGQLYIGATAAVAIGIVLGNEPSAIVIPAMMLGGAAGGALWGSIPGLLRAYLNTNEILTSLMLNYVAGLLISYLIFDSHSYWRSTGQLTVGIPQGKMIATSAWWPTLNVGSVAIPLGFMVGIGIALLMLAVLRTTRFGFQLRVMADAPRAAHYAGMHTRRMILAVIVLSGAIAGLAGASQVGDFSHLLDPNGLEQGAYGYTGIAAAALAGYNPVAAIPAAVLLGALTNAGFQLQGPSFPQGLVGTLEGIILFCVISGAMFVRYRVRWVPRGGIPSPAADELVPEVTSTLVPDPNSGVLGSALSKADQA
jgi:simple sugar transport system permease protein